MRKTTGLPVYFFKILTLRRLTKRTLFAHNNRRKALPYKLTNSWQHFAGEHIH
jgi:hypothetical protein